MAELVSTIGGTFPTCRASVGVVFTRGLRAVRQADFTYALAGIGERGQVVVSVPTDTLTGHFLGQAMSAGFSMPAVAAETVNSGDIAYTAANGQTSKTATGATRIGVWKQAAAVGAVGEIIPD